MELIVSYGKLPKITNWEDFYSIMVRLKTDLVANLRDVYVLIGHDHGGRRGLQFVQKGQQLQGHLWHSSHPEPIKNNNKLWVIFVSLTKFIPKRMACLESILVI